MLVLDLEHGLLDRQPVGLRGGEVGRHLHLDGVGERLAAGERGLGGAFGQRGLADRAQLVILHHLAVGLAKQLRAGFLQQHVAEATLEQRARGLALAEPGQRGLARQISEAVLEAGVDVLRLHGDGDALAGGACVLDLDFGLQFGGGVAHGSAWACGDGKAPAGAGAKGDEYRGSGGGAEGVVAVGHQGTSPATGGGGRWVCAGGVRRVALTAR